MNVSIDPLAPEVVADPYPHYRRLRENDPVHWHDGLQSWMLTTYADCKEVVRDAETYASDWRRVGVPTPPEMLSVQTVDPPEHRLIRRLLATGLHKQNLEALREDVEVFVRHQLKKLAGEPAFDFIQQLSAPVALRTITSFLGVPEPPLKEFIALSELLVKGMDSGLVPEAEEPGLKARAALSELVEDWYADPPAGGMVGFLAEHRGNAEIPWPILVNATRALLHAGYESSGRFIGNATAGLLRHPDAWQDLKDHPEILDNALDELIRFDGPVQAESRAATKSVTIGPKSIAEGDIVILLLGAANHDPAEFDNPDELDLRRNVRNHLGFGWGIHSCLGAPIAMMEARAVVTILIGEYPGLHLVGEPVQRLNATLRGIERLPVALGAV